MEKTTYADPELQEIALEYKVQLLSLMRMYHRWSHRESYYRHYEMLIGLRYLGHSWQRIAKTLGVSRTKVWRYRQDIWSRFVSYRVALQMIFRPLGLRAVSFDDLEFEFDED